MNSGADRGERECAVTAFDRNVVVTAGAGTGKTTLLVDRILHLVVREPDPVSIGEIVALTFTRKAAGEMLARLRARLDRARAVRLDRDPQSDDERAARAEVLDWMHRYRLSATEIGRRLGDALRDLDRAQIGTIHSFAATVLRLYPLEAGIDPRFQEADESRWHEHVEARWIAWLQSELGLGAPRVDLWRRLLARFSLPEVAEVARALCPEAVPLDGLLHPVAIPDQEVWRERMLEEVRALRGAHPGARKIERQLASAERVLLHAGEERPNAEDAELLGEDCDAPKGWAADEFRRATDLIRLAQRVALVDDEAVLLLGQVVEPFVRRCRAEFRSAGWMSFDGLLVGARDLLKNRPRVREALKQRFRAVLVDEFQDTDPIQYEILLYLGEARGRSETDWKRVTLEPGKLFIVGDPKQSIYGFRGADIEAYQNVVRLVLEQSGIPCTLSENFRSHAGLLDAVNGVGSRLIAYRPGLQPEYAPITPHDGSRIGPQPEIRLVRPPEGSFTADRAREAEAESLARWLATEVIARVPVVDRNGREASAAPCDVAILTRSLTEVHVLLDALRRWKIRYVVEGEKHFFATQDVVDAVNLLRTVSAPDDATALVGLLRSPLGGVNDRDLYELARAGLLDYRMVERPTALPAFAPATLYRELLALHRAVRVLPVGDAVSLVFDRLPLVLVAAAGRDADQAVANLEKLRRLAEALAADGARSLSAVIRLLDRRVREEAEEGESPLADEQVDAVKVMSIHKAKGLEFPIVVLIGAHAGIETGRPRAVAHHWSSGGVGLQIGAVASFTGVFLTDQLRRREAEEQNRLVYVAMTRARERFVVSAAPTARPARDSVLKRLEEALGPVTDGRTDGTIAIGKGAFRVRIVTASPAETMGVRPDVQSEVRVSADAERFLDQWRARRDRAEHLMNAPRFLTPTRLARRGDVAPDRATTHRVSGASTAEGERARRLGILVHRFLQYWDYGADPSSWRQMIERSGVPDAFEDRSGWLKDLETALAPFFASSIYRELAAARILGREVPLILPWEGAMMEGVIDLIYEREDRLYVADYKSDAVAPHEAPAAAERYRAQAEVYTRAVRESLGREVTAFRCLFLRLGTAVDLVVPSG